jgi:hypothetical protein
MLAYYIQFAVYDNNPNLAVGLVGPVTMVGSILAIPITVKLCQTVVKGTARTLYSGDIESKR